MNNTSNQQSFPSIAFVAGDTIGIGVMKDSFNQRTVFFTKNGNKIGIFEWRLHTGMDCFPGVSFSKSSGVVFSVNMSGPFKCDLKQVAEPRTDKDMLSTMPTEINEIIGAYCASSADRVLQLREVRQSRNVADSRLTCGYLTDEQAVCQDHAQQQSVALFVLAEMAQSEQEFEGQVMATTLSQEKFGVEISCWTSSHWYVNYSMWLTKTRPKKIVIAENCDFEFECPVLWEKLEAKGVTNPNERFCDKCHKTVYAGNYQ